MTETATHAGSRRGAPRPPISHAEDPVRPGIALCGAKLRGIPTTPGGDRCIVCRDLTRLDFTGR
jgi:hypothetical protein